MAIHTRENCVQNGQHSIIPTLSDFILYNAIINGIIKNYYEKTIGDDYFIDK